MGTGKGQQGSVNEHQNKDEGKGTHLTEDKGKWKSKDKRKSTRGKDKGKGHAPKGKGNTSGKGKEKKSEKHDFHNSTSTEGTTRAFPDQRSCILMDWQEDHEARKLETTYERAEIVESLENIGGAKVH